MRVPATRAILCEFGQLKMGVVLIKWARPKNSRALLLQPHHCNNPRSAPVYISARARTYPRGRPSIDLWDGRFM